MNKYKKIATAVIATVMAGTMVASLAACDPDGNTPSGGQKTLTPKLDENSKITYADNTELAVAIGYDKVTRGIRYHEDNITKLGADTVLAGGKRAAGGFKPAWQALQSQLKIKLDDKFDGTKPGENIEKIRNNSAIGGLAGVAMLTASSATITTEAAKGTLLDVSQYLDYMPNYKAFLESNDITYASLIGNKTGSMYMLPYFDGNDDIEKFVLLRKDLTSALLDATDIDANASKFITFKAQADGKNGATTKPVKSIVGTAPTVKAFMGNTNYSIDVTNPAWYEYTKSSTSASYMISKKESVTGEGTVKVYICYDKALAAAKTAGSALNTALTAAGLVEADITALTSGNIVDLQNAVITKTAGVVTGDKLLNILNAYIDVTYCTTEQGGTSFYAGANNGLKRSDVFNSASAAWDVDLYVALGRCFVTSGTYLGEQVKASELLYLLAGREYTTQRHNDLVCLAGELYGVRGLESRYNYSYIDKDGAIKDAREDAAMYEAMKNINDMALEGLFNTAKNITKDYTSGNVSDNKGIQTLSLHDYSQTQTAKVGFGANAKTYDFGPVLTPVSKWNDGNGVKYMRFTESWRGVKDGGIAVSYDYVKKSPEKLSAVLAFIDYLYSPDGQLVMTYGPQDTTNNSKNPNGLWYATEKTGVSLESVVDSTKTVAGYGNIPKQYTVKDSEKDKYFVYNGKVYEGTLYIDRQIPKMTDESWDVFIKKGKGSFTDYAREFLGTTLPLGNKDQGFEYLCTAECGKYASEIVNVALANGTMKHQYQTLDGTDGKGNYVGGGSAAAPNYWYTLVPTTLPYTKAQNSNVASGNMQAVSGLGKDGYNLYVSDSKVELNLLLDIMFAGYDTSRSLTCVNKLDKNLTVPADAAGCVAINNKFDFASLLGYKRAGWKTVNEWYSAYKAAQNA